MVRKNISGKLYSLVYGRVISSAIDPIEKKPLYHFMPGSSVYSIGTIGCNFKCSFCQNSDIAFPKEVSEDSLGEIISPEEIVENAIYYGCEGIAYTYNEPVIFAEMMIDTAKIAKENGLKNIMVTNGFITEEGFNEIKDCIDAVNIDLKAFTDEFYKKHCFASLQPVLDTIKRAKDYKIHTEITTLIIPGENDSEKEIREIARFIADIDKSMPWHISRFFPMHRLKNKIPTPRETLETAYKIGKEERLENVHLGNI